MLVEANWSMVQKPRAGSPKQSASSSGWRLGAAGSEATGGSCTVVIPRQTFLQKLNSNFCTEQCSIVEQKLRLSGPHCFPPWGPHLGDWSEEAARRITSMLWFETLVSD